MPSQNPALCDLALRDKAGRASLWRSHLHSLIIIVHFGFYGELVGIDQK